MTLGRELREQLCREYLDRYLAAYGTLPTLKEAYIAVGAHPSVLAAIIREYHDRGAKPSPHEGEDDDIFGPAPGVPVLKREEVLACLGEHRKEIGEKFGVRSLGIFGSVARDEGRPDSDLDVLVDFDGDPTYDRYYDLKVFLEELLDCKVDLVMETAVKPRLRPYIAKDAVYVT